MDSIEPGFLDWSALIWERLIFFDGLASASGVVLVSCPGSAGLCSSAFEGVSCVLDDCIDLVLATAR